MAFAYQGTSATLTAIPVILAESLNPYAAAMIAVSAYIVDKAAPDTAPATVNDGLPDWNVAVQATKQAKQANGNYSTDALISPASAVELFDSQNVQAEAEYWGMSSWTLVKKIYWRHYTWKGDQYGTVLAISVLPQR